MNTLLVLGAVLLLGFHGFGPWPMLCIVGGTFVLLAFQLIVRQESMLYMPCPMPGMRRCCENPEGHRSPKDRGLQFEDVYLTAEDGVKVHAWFLPARGEPAGTLIFCHGNAGNIGLRIPNFEPLVVDCRLNILAFDYRGYGDSEGEPDEAGLIKDATAAWAWVEAKAAAGPAGIVGSLKTRVEPGKLFVFGRSLGGAVAIALARKLQARGCDAPGTFLPTGLILENTFTSIWDLVDDLFPWIAFDFLKRQFLRLGWKSLDRIADLESPLLFLSAAQDEVVPPANMRKLYEAAKASKLHRVVSFPTGMHNDTFQKGGEAYWVAIRQFVEHCQLLTSLPEK